MVSSSQWVIKIISGSSGTILLVVLVLPVGMMSVAMLALTVSYTNVALSDTMHQVVLNAHATVVRNLFVVKRARICQSLAAEVIVGCRA